MTIEGWDPDDGCNGPCCQPRTRHRPPPRHLLRTLARLITGRPLPPRCHACGRRTFGGYDHDQDHPFRRWHPECQPTRQEKP